MWGWCRVDQQGGARGAAGPGVTRCGEETGEHEMTSERYGEELGRRGEQFLERKKWRKADKTQNVRLSSRCHPQVREMELDLALELAMDSWRTSPRL